MKAALSILRHLYTGDLLAHTPVRSIGGQAAGYSLILVSNVLGLRATHPTTAGGWLLWTAWAGATVWLVLVVVLTWENLRRRLSQTSR